MTMAGGGGWYTTTGGGAYLRRGGGGGAGATSSASSDADGAVGLASGSGVGAQNQLPGGHEEFPLGADCAAATAGTPITRARAVEERTNFVMALEFLLFASDAWGRPGGEDPPDPHRMSATQVPPSLGLHDAKINVSASPCYYSFTLLSVNGEEPASTAAAPGCRPLKSIEVFP
jgi:hypothetical protein